MVDALLSGEGNELNVNAALAQMQKRRGDIVRVNDANARRCDTPNDPLTSPSMATMWFRLTASAAPAS